MGDQTNETVHFKIQKERTKAGDVLMRVYEAMSERGYDPVNQIVGYLISGDPTYITSYNNARYLIRMLERDELLEELVKKAGDDIEIMVGSGVDAEVIRGLYPQVKAHAWHMSGKMTLDSQMRYRKEDVNMGLPTFSEFEVWRTSEEKVRAAVEALKEL